MSRENAQPRLSSTPDEERMVVSASSEAQPPTGAAIHSPGQPCSSTNPETADVIIEEDSTEAVSRVKGLLSCSACGVLLQHGEHTPKLLPSCLHTVCSRCSEQGNSEEGFQCGLCMTTSPEVLDHPLVEELLQREHVQQCGQFCGQCDERGERMDAAGTCEQCNMELCKVCISAHQRTKATWTHNISMFDFVFTEPQCPKHNKVYDNYCDTCREMGCGDCILSSHRSHESCTLEAKDAEIKRRLQASLENMRELRASLSQKMDILKKGLAEADSSKQQGIELIQGHHQDYQERIRDFFNKQLVAAQERYDMYGHELQTLLESVSLMELRLAHLDNFAHRLLENGRPATLIGNAKYILALAKKLGMVDINCQPANRLPKMELRRILPIDRIGDMISLALFDDGKCIQPTLHDACVKAFLVTTAQIMYVQLRSQTDFGVKHSALPQQLSGEGTFTTAGLRTVIGGPATIGVPHLFTPQPGPSRREFLRGTLLGGGPQTPPDGARPRKQPPDRLVPLSGQTPAGVRPEELTHVVRVPESVANGEAALDWEPARDPLGICFPRGMLYEPPARGPTSPNISYCVLCWDGGDLLLCDSCERAFHRECYVGPAGDEEGEDSWLCLMCRVMPSPMSPLDRRPGDTMNETDMTLARRLLTELYACYYPAMYFKSLQNMSKLPEFDAIEKPVCLDGIKERLLNHEFETLMGFLRTTKKLVDQIRFFKRGTPVHKYLRELDEKFEEFLQLHMKDFWLQLDDKALKR
ncbi:E3 ubiquitin-protein ligase TRIM33 [Amphibalanus amphitrite]|uniref:E3 ubiquitin-protein ligase TRIM33 n=1 Tax=Amphibalanus amphitrite TaxID=1232801 RepID=A0A6A4VZ41_AMPAM|nr:E3 ubiquitin-protein ligase TRIM33 [Amphibalanus amphitrite]